MGNQDIKVIFWDFDGVLMDSNLVRESGFKWVLRSYNESEVEALIAFHRLNGGLSRYVKFRYFYEVIRNEVCDSSMLQWCYDEFSKYMALNLFDKGLLIKETLSFVESNLDKYDMHIVSGSDDVELKLLCQFLEIHPFFISINGSPIEKEEHVRLLIDGYNYKKMECLLIGDSINDREAAIVNNISFMSYNNKNLHSCFRSSVKFMF